MHEKIQELTRALIKSSWTKTPKKMKIQVKLGHKMNSLSRNATSLMANARNRKDSLTNEEEKVFVRESGR